MRADAPFDAHDLMDYFEVTILSEGKKNTITVGLSSDDFVATKLPGWDLFSFGYHAGDGKKYTYKIIVHKKIIFLDKAKRASHTGPHLKQMTQLAVVSIITRRKYFLQRMASIWVLHL